MAIVPGVLSDDDLRRIADEFGVDDEQVRRDHLISHVLAAIAEVPGVVFYGGTALTRTVFPSLRLSEDIDLLALRSRREVGRDLRRAIEHAFARSFGEVVWAPPLDETRSVEYATLTVEGRKSIQLQLVDGVGRAHWPSAIRDIEQRYADAPPARLTTLTDDGFAAAKLSAWLDRNASRDLYDLWALAESGRLTEEAAALVRRRTNWTAFPHGVQWPPAPEEAKWNTDLAHQTRLQATAAEAHRAVLKHFVGSI